MVNRLLGIEILGILDTKTQEVTQLGGGVDLSLESILSLTVHGQSHDVVTVLGRDEIRSLEEDAGPLRKGSRSPGLTGSQGGINGGLDLRSRGIGIGGEGSVRGRVGLGERRVFDLCSGDGERNVHVLVVFGQGILKSLAIRSARGICFLYAC